MSPDRDEEQLHDDPTADAWDTETTPTLLGRTWFRVALFLVVAAAVTAVSVSYIMESTSPPPVVPTPTPRAVVAASTSAQASSVAQRADEKKREGATSPSAPVAADPGTTTPRRASETSTARADGSAAASRAAPPSIASMETKSRSARTEAPSPERMSRGSASGETTERPARTAKLTDANSAANAPKRRSGARSPADESRSPGVATTATPGKLIGAETGDWWVQVGAYADPDMASRTAGALKRDSYRVQESAIARRGHAPPASTAGESTGTDRYEVFVTGRVPADVAEKLAAKGLSADAIADGAVVRPALALRDAVALSRELTDGGFTVQVRRTTNDGSRAAPPATTSGGTLHRVRVGAFPDRASAVAVLRKLEQQGYRPYVARGNE